MIGAGRDEENEAEVIYRAVYINKKSLLLPICVFIVGYGPEQISSLYEEVIAIHINGGLFGEVHEKCPDILATYLNIVHGFALYA